MLKITMLIPLTDNQGIPIDPNEIGRHLYSILQLCGGYTRSEPNYTGVWQDSSGRAIFDRLFQLVVCCPEDKLTNLKIIAAKIAATCRQECLYFEYFPVTLDFVTP